MKLAAYQAPLSCTDSRRSIEFVRRQIKRCEFDGVSVLCCPEALIGGLADYSSDPAGIAMSVCELEMLLMPVASDRVSVIVGFSERGDDGRLYNSAAVVTGGLVKGVYRKQRPALRRSVYTAGSETPIFAIGGLIIGIVICNDSNFPELARAASAQGATVLLIPTNNGLPAQRAGAELIAQTRQVDMGLARANKAWVVRADVAGSWGQLLGHGCSSIVAPSGEVIRSAAEFAEELLIAEVPN
jgi:5-aminopentanamidase